jgi:hypothetical protein
VKVEHLRQAVVVVVGIHLVLATHVKQDRNTSFLGERPQRFERHVAGAMSRWAARWNDQTLAPQHQRFSGNARRFFEVDQRHVAGGQQPFIHAAEVHHHAVVCPRGCARQRIGIAGLQAVVVQRIGGKHQLAGKAEVVERLRSIFLAKRTKGRVAPPQHDLRFGMGQVLGVIVQRLHFPNPGGISVSNVRLERVEVLRRNEFTDLVGELHHM